MSFNNWTLAGNPQVTVGSDFRKNTLKWKKQCTEAQSLKTGSFEPRIDIKIVTVILQRSTASLSQFRN